MITANALGIPTRYVTNEAHAFVEVWLPGADWMRIDLGGAASTLDVSNANEKAMYKERGEDPFEQPPSYADNYTNLTGDIRGLREDQIAERQERYLSDENGEDFFGAGEEALDQGDGPLAGPGQGLPEIPPAELEGKTPTRTRVASASPSGFRGEAIWVEGSVVDESGVGLDEMRIDIFLAPAGQQGDGAVLVGRGRSAYGGQFRVEVSLPTSLELSRYEVFASTPGNSSFQPSVSN
jgi:hypothetical protein